MENDAKTEINETEKHARVFAAPFFGANLSEQLLCWSITACSNQQGRAEGTRRKKG